jgi:ribonuclease P protein component
MPTGAKKTGVSDDIFSSGRCFQGKFLKLYLKKGRDKNPVLFCVAKRIFRTKPQRNRLRRILKAAFVSQQDNLKLRDYSLALILCSAKAQFSDLQQELADLSRRALQIP